MVARPEGSSALGDTVPCVAGTRTVSWPTTDLCSGQAGAPVPISFWLFKFLFLCKTRPSRLASLADSTMVGWRSRWRGRRLAAGAQGRRRGWRPRRGHPRAPSNTSTARLGPRRAAEGLTSRHTLCTSPSALPGKTTQPRSQGPCLQTRHTGASSPPPSASETGDVSRAPPEKGCHTDRSSRRPVCGRTDRTGRSREDPLLCPFAGAPPP